MRGPKSAAGSSGVSCALSETEPHWRVFLDSLVARGMRGLTFITSDDHPGLGAARQAVLAGFPWQRCQYHLAQNAIHHAPNLKIRKAHRQKSYGSSSAICRQCPQARSLA